MYIAIDRLWIAFWLFGSDPAARPARDRQREREREWEREAAAEQDPSNISTQAEGETAGSRYYVSTQSM